MTIAAPRDGGLSAVDTFGLGELVVAIGGGRRAKADVIDPRVGFLIRRRVGDTVRRGEPLIELHLAAEDRAAATRAVSCFRIEQVAPAPLPLVIERVE